MANPKNTSGYTSGKLGAWLVIAWLWVGVPLAWGIYNTLLSSLPLFK